MLAFIIRRLLQAIVVMLTVALIAFTLFRFVGDPVNQMVGIETTRGGARSAARAARPQRSDPRPVRALSSATPRSSISASRISSRRRSST